MDKKILLKLEAQSSEDEFEEVEITEDAECAFLEIVIKNYDKEDWIPRAEQHNVDLEQAVIDLMDVLCVSVHKHYHRKNSFVRDIFNDLEFGRDVESSMGTDYTDDTMWGRVSAVFKMTATSNYDEKIKYEKREIKVKKDLTK